MARSETGLPERVETVLLDAGGVLLDLDYSYLRRLIESRHRDVNEAALSRAEAVARLEISRRIGEAGNPNEVWRDYFHLILHEVGLPVAGHDPVIDSLWEAHQRVGLWTSAVPGALEVVQGLKGRGLRVGVISNAEGQVARDLDVAGFAGQLDAVVDSHVVGVQKPDPEIFRIGLRELGAEAATSVFVGDVPAIDIVGARAAGIAPILLDRHDLYADADAPRLRSIRELPALLDEQGMLAG